LLRLRHDVLLRYWHKQSKPSPGSSLLYHNYPNAHADANADPNTNSNLNTNSDPDSDPNSARDSLTDADANAISYSGS
jgi:hypothetical protein